MLIVITGASRGIGFELVKRFAITEKHYVIAVSRNTAPLLELVRAKKLEKVAAAKKLGMPVDVLINNAGQIVNKPFGKISEKELKEVYDTNVFAPFMLMQAIMPLLSEKRSHIVNISSMGGFQGSVKFPGLSAYSSSKAAIASLSECLAVEYKTRNVTVNCLAIGAVQTEMLSKAFPNYRAPLRSAEMAEFICEFALHGWRYFNGKVLPVSSTTP
jgi:NAD(P)-dependent dehydrogenase (short-subunit alcohol dehydrogenase family)